MKDRICSAFCDALTVASVPAGLVVTTPFVRSNGDAIGFYIIADKKTSDFRIEDDGLTIPDLEASGFDLQNQTRNEELRSILDDYKGFLDEENLTLFIGPIKEHDVATECLRFMQLLIRIYELHTMADEKVASTFKQDALIAIQEAIGERAAITEDAYADERLKEFVADVVIKSDGRPPCAVFFVKTDARLLEAVLLHNVAQYEKKIQCNVVALLEKNSSIKRDNWSRATNRLSAVTVFSDDRKLAAERIAREALGASPTFH